MDTNNKEREQPVQEKRPRLDPVQAPPPVTRQVLQTPAQEMILKVELEDTVTSHQSLIVVKVRSAESEDQDYIEIELPGDNLTLDNLILVASTELGLKVR